MSKENRLQADDKINELIDHFSILNQHAYFSNLGIKKIMQCIKHTNTYQTGETKQSGNNRKTGKNSTGKHKIMLYKVFLA